MISARRLHPFTWIIAGLLGMSLYQVALRFPHPEILARDFARGGWSGVCIGLEILGLIQLRRPRSRHAA